MKIQFNDLNAQWQIIKKNTLKEFENLFKNSNFILGDQVKTFENNFSKYINSKYSVGVSNGTDALKLSAQALDLKGSICFILPANTYIATILGPEQAYPNAHFEIIDCDNFHQIDVKKTEKFLKENSSRFNSIVLIPVHLYGYSCDMDELMRIKKQYNCYMIEDSSQAHGAQWKGKTVGTFGDVSAFSLYPGKNLGAAGDAGVISTNSKQIYNKLLKLRSLGSVEKYVHDIKGGNHRLDTLQAIILNEKIKFIEDWNKSRRSIANFFDLKISNPKIKLPKTQNHCLPVHHIYPVLVDNRDDFTTFLDKHSIQWGIHYPICIEEMCMYKNLVSNPNTKALSFSEHMVSLPMHPFLNQQQLDYLVEILNVY